MTGVDILLIEPDKMLAQTYAAALGNADFQVVIVPGAEAAIRAVDSAVPKLIILELQLAAHNGVEFLYELRSYPEWQSIPVVILSSVPQTESGISSRNASKLGITHYCYKPATSLKKLVAITKDHIPV